MVYTVEYYNKASLFWLRMFVHGPRYFNMRQFSCIINHVRKKGDKHKDFIKDNIGRYSTEKVSMRILYSKRLVVYSSTL